MAFKIKSYKELVAMTKEKLDEALIPLRVKSAKNRADAEVIKLEERMMTIEVQLNEKAAKMDIDFAGIIDLIDDYDLANRRLAQLKVLVADLFPAEG